MLPFWISIALLSLAQGAIVALPGVLTGALSGRFRSRRWALVPPLSIVVFVFGTRAAERASAQGLTYLALVAVPVLAALALGWLVWREGARFTWALLVVPLFVLAWADHSALPGQGAAFVLSALSCVSLGVLLAAVTPPRWLAAGIIAMSVADCALVISDLLQQPNNTLNAARPIANLPQLQSAVFGLAVMGYGDLFIAAALGGLLALSAGRGVQLRIGALVGLLALAFDLLFFLVDELPATVPVAVALLVSILTRRLRFGPDAGTPIAPRQGPAAAARESAPHRTPAAW